MNKQTVTRIFWAIVTNTTRKRKKSAKLLNSIVQLFPRTITTWVASNKLFCWTMTSQISVYMSQLKKYIEGHLAASLSRQPYKYIDHWPRYIYQWSPSEINCKSTWLCRWCYTRKPKYVWMELANKKAE